MNPYVLASISLLGVVVGALLQFVFSRRATDWSRLQEKRVQAYVDFLTAVARLARAQRGNKKGEAYDSRALLTDAKVRIAVYAHSKVIPALAEFQKTDPMLMSPIASGAFMKLIEIMRQVSKAGSAATGYDEFYAILFGYEPSSIDSPEQNI
jgi:hypothetical protein